MSLEGNRIHIDHISRGFQGLVGDTNFSDSHRPLEPFGMKWGRGILIRGNGYLEAVTGPYGTSHSLLKNELCKDETSAGAFYYGYELATKTLHLEYASDRTFDLLDKDVLVAIMDSLRKGSGPLKDFVMTGTQIQSLLPEGDAPL